MDFSSIKELYIPEGKVKMITFPNGSSYTFGPEPYNDQYLTIESLEDGNEIGLIKNNTDSPTVTVQYSIDKINWSSATSSTTNITLATLNTGDKLYIKGDNASYSVLVSGYIRYNYFTSTKTFNLYGNIMSLINSTFFKTLVSFTNTHTFPYLFYQTKVVDASNLILPVTTLATSCYRSMFQGCTSLITPPELPATSLADYCYQIMFQDCTSLITPPELPATTLAQSCYSSMFKNCTSLTTVPELPATTLANNCYDQMFNGCESLTTLPSDLLPATTLANNCYNSMFYLCTNITSAPNLLASTLVTGCYGYMFRYCEKLSYIKMIATDISASNCLSTWVQRVASTGTFVKHPNTTISTGNSGIPTGWTVQTATS